VIVKSELYFGGFDNRSKLYLRAQNKKGKKIALSLDDEPPFLFPPWEWLIQRKVSENPTKLLFS
jgi:hypothetical protein